MTILKGKVSDVRHSTHVSGDENGTSTTQIAIFDIDNQAVRLSLSSPPIIKNDDEVMVSGELKRGVLVASAYKNLSRNVNDGGAPIVYWIVGIVFCCSIILSPFGIWLLLKAMRLKGEYEALFTQ